MREKLIDLFLVAACAEDITIEPLAADRLADFLVSNGVTVRNRGHWIIHSSGRSETAPKYGRVFQVPCHRKPSMEELPCVRCVDGGVNMSKGVRLQVSTGVLKPCPKCGKIPKVYRDINYEIAGFGAWCTIECKPFLRKPHFKVEQGKALWTRAFEYAVNIWNGWEDNGK